MTATQLISLHISYREATFSTTALRRGIANDPAPEHLENMRAVAENIFEPLRIKVGGPIAITSFYRCAALNIAIGGARTSQHTTGEAIDLDMDGIADAKWNNARLFEHIRTQMKFDQLIWEFGDKTNPDWVHVSYTTSRPLRKQVLRAVSTRGRSSYIPWKP